MTYALPKRRRVDLGETPPGAEKMDGWLKTEVRMRFGLLDRLRLLLTGGLHISVTNHTDAKVDEALSHTDWYIVPPFGRR